ncbi:hypothetical protein NA56DRAFT_699119 [Hyaloscypha hepaticicola]|uniref:Secreted protein n=1 Tax=Hyaloscypha hepaticicola TaxID=2082293 RepID=A0A2J6QIE8_9HELO|nr:hypothetical protein NA56DRAFT_699119 [Hyaloscypha hepaticicola]
MAQYCIVLVLSLMAWKDACQLSPVSRIAYHSDLKSLFRSQALFNIQEGCARGSLIWILLAGSSLAARDAGHDRIDA